MRFGGLQTEEGLWYGEFNECFARRRGAGADLGNYGDRRLSHLSDFGYCGFDGGWFPLYGGAVCIMLMLSGQSVWVAMFGALAAGMLAGLVTGILHTFMGIPAILSGILTQLGLYSVNLKIMGKANQAINVDKFPLLVSLRFIKGVPFLKNTLFVVALTILALILILYWFFGTELGCSLRATGCNDKMARAQGINTDVARVLGLMLSNGLVALSGAFLGQYQGFADVNMVVAQSLSAWLP